MKGTYTPAPAISLYESIRMLEEAGNRVVRQGIRKNLVTFPSEVPVFKKTTRPDLQAKFAVLYFVCGWSASQIAERYGLGRQRVTQILTKWRLRAVRQGYIQLIDEATVIPASFLDDVASGAQNLAVTNDKEKLFDPVQVIEALRECDARGRTNISLPTMENAASMFLG